MDDLEQIAVSVPTFGINATPDWDGVREAVTTAGFDPSSVLAASWCRFGDRLNPVGSGAPDNGRDAVAFVFPTGIIATIGKRSRFRGELKSDVILFASCRSTYTNHFQGQGFGYYMIHFVGPGEILLGFLYWSYMVPRFRASRSDQLVVAEEHERILRVTESLVGVG